MESPSSPISNTKQQNRDVGDEATQKLSTILSSDRIGGLEQKLADSTGKNSQNDSYETIEGLNTAQIPAANHSIVNDKPLEIIDTMRLPAQAEIEMTQKTSTTTLKAKQRPDISRG